MKFCSDDEDLTDMFGPCGLDKALTVICPLNDSGDIRHGGSHWAMLFIIRDSLQGALSCFVMDSAASGSCPTVSVANQLIEKLVVLMRATKPAGGATWVRNYPM